MKKKHFLFLTFLLSVIGLFAFEPLPTDQLLMSYLENDLDLQKLTLAAEKAELSYDSSKIDAGIDVNLATGVINFKTSEKGLSVKTSPTLKVNIPQANNLSLSTGISINSDKDKVVSDTSINVGVDIISSNRLSNEVSLLNAERSRNIAIKNLEEKALDKEKAFYTELKSLLNTINTVIQSQKNYYTDLKNFESVKAKGYSKSSSTYRTAEIEIFSDKNTIQNQIASLRNEFVMFYKKCGLQIEIADNMNIMNFIPADIPEVELLDVESFNKENFAELENAKWNYKINSMKRDINKNFSLSANAGYTFDNSLTNSDTVNIGVNSTIGGLNLQAGVNIPVIEDPYPSFTLSTSINPNTFRKNSNTKKQNNLSEQQELLDIQIAENNYENFVTSSKQNAEELLLKKETTEQNYEMYQSLENDMKEWYEKGVVPESDYLTAIINANLYKVKLLINDIDFIIYNSDLNKKFITPTQK